MRSQSGPDRCQGQPGGDFETTSRSRPGVELAAEQLAPLAHAGDPTASPGRPVGLAAGDAYAAPVVLRLDRSANAGVTPTPCKPSGKGKTC